MVEDSNRGFGSPVEQKNSQTNISYASEISKVPKNSQILELLKELKKADTSKNYKNQALLLPHIKTLSFLNYLVKKHL